VCITKNDTETSVMTTTATANNLPIIYPPRCAVLKTKRTATKRTPGVIPGMWLSEELRPLTQ
jgi:hypothetical protein